MNEVVEQSDDLDIYYDMSCESDYEELKRRASDYWYKFDDENNCLNMEG